MNVVFCIGLYSKAKFLVIREASFCQPIITFVFFIWPFVNTWHRWHTHETFLGRKINIYREVNHLNEIRHKYISSISISGSQEQVLFYGQNNIQMWAGSNAKHWCRIANCITKTTWNPNVHIALIPNISVRQIFREDMMRFISIIYNILLRKTIWNDSYLEESEQPSDYVW